VRELYKKLRAEAWIDPWLDEEKLLPGQDWHMEIEKAVEVTDVVVVLLSNQSVSQEGYVQRELKLALDVAEEKPEGTIFITPLRLDDCPAPRRLKGWHYVDYFPADRKGWAVERLIASLKARAESLGLKFEKPTPPKINEAPVGRVSNPTKSVPPESTYKPPVQEKKPVIETPKPAKVITPSNKLVLSNGMEFMRVPASKFLMGGNNGRDNEKNQHTVDIPYDYWMARYPITNEQYNVYAKVKGISHPVSDWQKKKDHPVVKVNWDTAIEYCRWLNNLLKAELPSGMSVLLPTEAEWEKAAHGTDEREYPWGNTFDKNKCNSSEGGKGGTTSVETYHLQGASPYGCADMSGNVWEWTHSEYKLYPYNEKDGREDEQKSVARVVRGGAYLNEGSDLRCACRGWNSASRTSDLYGFRVVISRVSNPTSIAPTPAKVSTPPNKLSLSNGIDFMHIPAGKFLMGNDNGNESPQHTVDIPYDYWMARFPVTNEQYNEYVKARGIPHPVDDWQKKKNHPVVNVSWDTVVEYCRWQSNLPKSELASGLVLRLPTEAEWEKAARGIDGREYPWGNTFEKNKCNSKESKMDATTPVGMYSPQGDTTYGCADMSGNVWEWTHSEYKTYPYNITDGREEEQKNILRVLRGGSFRYYSDFAHCACRIGLNPTFNDLNLGFRVVISQVFFNRNNSGSLKL